MKNLIQRPNKPATVNWSLGMSCLNDRNWLDDRAIDNAQNVLKKQFPDVEGLQSSLVIEFVCVYTPSCSYYAQIYNYSRNHWLTLTKKADEESCITIYDSLGVHINDHLKSICAALLFSKEKSYKNVISK